MITNEAMRNRKGDLLEPQEDAAFLNALTFLSERQSQLNMRHASLEHAEKVYKLSTNPVVLSNSTNSSMFAYESHLVWYNVKLSDPSHIFLLFFKETKLLGQVRFNKSSESVYEVSISIDPAHQRIGYGRDFLGASLTFLIAAFKPSCVVAEIKINNVASIKLFKSIGFCCSEAIIVKGSDRFHKWFRNEKETGFIHTISN